MKTRAYKAMAAALLAVLSLGGIAYAGSWSLPITVKSGGSAAQIALGIANGAIHWSDAVHEQPAPSKRAAVDGYFPRTDWGVVVAGQVIAAYQRDTRKALSQEHHFEVISGSGMVELKWDTSKVPPSIHLGFSDTATGAVTDMRTVVGYQFNGGSQPHGFNVTVDTSDQPAPAAPHRITAAGTAKDMTISWPKNSESDIEGYRLYIGARSGSYDSNIDLKDIQTYTLKREDAGKKYFLALTAYNTDGAESERSAEVVFVEAHPAPAVTQIAAVTPGAVLVTKAAEARAAEARAAEARAAEAKAAEARAAEARAAEARAAEARAAEAKAAEAKAAEAKAAEAKAAEAKAAEAKAAEAKAAEAKAAEAKAAEAKAAEAKAAEAKAAEAKAAEAKAAEAKAAEAKAAEAKITLSSAAVSSNPVSKENKTGGHRAASAAACRADLLTSSKMVNRSSQTINLGVTGCESAVTSNAQWIIVANSGADGVTLSVQLNESVDPRMGTVTIGDKTFTVMQTSTDMP